VGEGGAPARVRPAREPGPRREGGAPTWGDALAALWCAIRLRCPQCRRGELFPRLLTLTLNERCPSCGLKFDRGHGYFTGALALNLVLAEVVAMALWVPLSVDRDTPLLAAYAVGIGASIGLPILAFRHTRAFWIALDRLLNPVA
jgi:uncharacterized protein (DUF983 family)